MGLFDKFRKKKYIKIEEDHYEKITEENYYATNPELVSKNNNIQIKFFEKYNISSKSTKESAINHITKGKLPIVTGTYNNGIISVLDIDVSANIMKSWKWKFQENFIPIISTSLGDLFMYNNVNKKCYYCQPEYDYLTLITDSIDELLNKALLDNGIIDHVLFKNKFSDIFTTIGQLKYGEAYILVPWSILGGKDITENYSIGDLTTYLELISQTLEKIASE